MDFVVPLVSYGTCLATLVIHRYESCTSDFESSLFVSEELCRKHGWILSSLLSLTGEPSFPTKQSLYVNIWVIGYLIQI